MGQVIQFPKQTVSRQFQDELQKFVDKTLVKLAHPSCGNLSEAQKAELLNKAIKQFVDSKGVI